MAGIPWATIIKSAPALLAAADALLLQTRRRNVTEVSGDLNALRQRVAELDEQQRASAELVKQLAAQVSAMAQAAQGSAAILRRAYMIAIAGTVLGAIGCLLAIFR